MSNAQSLIAELDTVLGTVSEARQCAMLRDVTDLFLGDAERYSRPTRSRCSTTSCAG